MTKNKGTMHLLHTNGCDISIGYHVEHNRVSAVSYNDATGEGVVYGKFNDIHAAQGFMAMVAFQISQAIAASEKGEADAHYTVSENNADEGDKEHED